MAGLELSRSSSSCARRYDRDRRRRAPPTTACCCRRCWPARSATTTSSCGRAPGTPSTASTLLTGAARVALDPAERAASRSSTASRLAFDQLVLATGSEPIRLPLPGSDLAGRHHVPRSSTTSAAMRGRGRGTPAVVIGGGLLGIEAAYGLARAGCQVTLVHLMDRLMERQLDAARRGLLQRRARKPRASRSCSRRRRAPSTAAAACERVELEGRAHLSRRLVVMAVGIRRRHGARRRSPASTSAAASSSTTGSQTSDARHLRHRRMRRAPRHLLRPGRARLRAGAGARPPPRRRPATLRRLAARRPTSRSPACPSSRPATSTARAPRPSCSRTTGPRLPQARDPRRPARRRGAGRRYAPTRSGISTSSAQAGLASRRSGRARVRQGLRGGRLMSAQDFTDEQKRYLEGFVSGVQARRAAQGLKPLGARRRRRGAEPTGPDTAHLAAMARFEADGRKLVARGEGQARRASLRRLRAPQGRERQGPVPQGRRQLPLALPRPVLRGADAELLHVPAAHPQRHPDALAVRRHRRPRRALRRRLRARHDARQPADPRDRCRDGAMPLIEGLTGSRPHHQGHRRRQHPQRHRLAHGRHRPAGAARHPSLRARLAPPHPQRPLALRPAAQVQRRLRRRRRHPGAGGHQRHRLHGGERRRGRRRRRRASGSGSGSAASPATRTSPALRGVFVKPEDAVAVADAIVRVFIDHGDRTDRKKARLKYVLDAWGFDKFLAEVEAKLGRQLVRASPPSRCRRPTARTARPTSASMPRSSPARSGSASCCRSASMTAEQMRGLAEIARELRRRRYPPHRLAEPADLRRRRGNADARRALPAARSASPPRPPASAPASSPAPATPAASSRPPTPRARRWRSPTGWSRASRSTRPINIHLTGCPHSCAQHYIGDIGLIACRVPVDDAGEDTVEGFHVLRRRRLRPGRRHRPRALPRRQGRGLPATRRAHPAGLPRASRSGPDETFLAFTRRHEIDGAEGHGRGVAGGAPHDGPDRQSASADAMIPEARPSPPEQRAWLNGFFAGLLSLDAKAGAAALDGASCRTLRPRRWPAEDDGAPWHDAAMPIDERMTARRGQAAAAPAVRRHGAAGLRPVRLSVRDLLGGHRRRARRRSSICACPAARRRAAC